MYEGEGQVSGPAPGYEEWCDQQDQGNDRMIVSLHLALVMLCVKYWIQFGACTTRRSLRYWSMYRAMKLAKCLENKYYEEHLREQRLFRLKKRRLRGDILSLYYYVKGGCNEVGAGLFSLLSSDRT